MKKLIINNKEYDIEKKPLIMGILNVTPDSFSDGGRFFSTEKAIKHALNMQKQGADIIDIGGESTRPGAKKITTEEELKRILPVLEELTKKLDIPISIDTYKSKVAQKTLISGASMINDITALRADKKLVQIIANKNVPVCLMHMKGTPENMQKNPEYKDVIAEIYEFLNQRIKYAITNKIKEENIIIDPGLGFGKRTGQGIEDNLLILKKLKHFKKLNKPILIGASRKTFIGNINDLKKTLPPSERLEGSLTAAIIAMQNGANILRVHDVAQTRRCVDFVEKLNSIDIQ